MKKWKQTLNRLSASYDWQISGTIQSLANIQEVFDIRTMAARVELDEVRRKLAKARVKNKKR